MKKNGKKGMRERAHWVGAVFLLLVVLTVGFLLASKITIRRNVYLRCSSVTLVAAREQTLDFSHDLGTQFDILDTLAAYIGGKAEFDFARSGELMRAFLQTNDLCTLTYADKTGQIGGAVSLHGDPPSGSVADREYFQAALHAAENRVLRYLPGTGAAGEERVILAVPVVRGSAADGVLIASMEQSVFERKLWLGKVENHAEAFLIDPSGTILADMTDTGVFQDGYNIFDSFITGETARELQQAMKAAKSGILTIPGKAGTVASYVPTGINGWYSVSVMDRATALERYGSSRLSIRNMVLIMGGFALISAVALLILFYFSEKDLKKTAGELKATADKLTTFLEKSGQALFYYDVRTMLLTVSDALEGLLQYRPPEDWSSVIAGRREQHPEFDYQGMMGAYTELVVSGGYREVTSVVRTGSKEMRWVKFSMTTETDEQGRLRGVVGVGTDVTETYVRECLEKQGVDHAMREVLTAVPLLVSVNLSRDLYSIVNYAAFPEENRKTRLSATGKYSDMIDRIRQLIPESHRSAWAETFSAGELIRAYENGSTTVEMEHPVITVTDGREHRFLSRVVFLTKESSEICCNFLAVNADGREKGGEGKEKDALPGAEESGTPPTEDVEQPQTGSRVTIHTFGFFDVYVKGRPILFPHEKSKEMLAVLVDRKGGFVSSSEMISYLWENEDFDKTTQSRCRQVAVRLKKTLEEYGVGDIIEVVNGQRRIVPEKVDCDYFNYLTGRTEYAKLFGGSYMMNYSWAETTTADLQMGRSPL